MMSHNSLGSSETTREASLSFNFDDYIQFGTPQHRPNPDTSFLEWFIGFTEAEGSFLVFKEKNTERLGFSMDQQDPQLLFKIKNKLGFGEVKNTKNNNWRYQTYNFKNLQRLFCLFNGNLILEKKRKQFLHWAKILLNKNFNLSEALKEVDLKPNKFDFQLNLSGAHLSEAHLSEAHLNKVQAKGAKGAKGQAKGPNLVRKPEGTGPGNQLKPFNLKVSLNNAWLSGFSEGNAGFFCHFKNGFTEKTGKGYTLLNRYYLTQKGEEDVLLAIGKLFQRDINLSKLRNGTKGDSKDVLYYRLDLRRLESQLFVVKYFEKYPLQGKTKINFLRWKRVLYYRTEQRPLTKKGIAKLQRLCEKIS